MKEKNRFYAKRLGPLKKCKYIYFPSKEKLEIRINENYTNKKILTFMYTLNRLNYHDD